MRIHLQSSSQFSIITYSLRAVFSTAKLLLSADYQTQFGISINDTVNVKICKKLDRNFGSVVDVI